MTNHLISEQETENLDIYERLLSAAIAGGLLYSSIFGRAKLTKASIASFLFYRAITGNCPAYSAMGRHTIRHAQNVNIRTSIIVDSPREEVYAVWRKLENLPKFMKHLVSVTETDSIHSTWRASIPGLPATISWDAEIVKEDDEFFIGWESLPGSDIGNAGKVEFHDIGREKTEINAVITYRAPVGIPGEKIARLLNPTFERLVKEDLENFKKYIETGEGVAV